jgi:hypothetical protein
MKKLGYDYRLPTRSYDHTSHFLRKTARLDAIAVLPFAPAIGRPVHNY